MAGIQAETCTPLNDDSLWDVLNELYDVRSKWKVIGLGLRVPPSDLEAISGNPLECLQSSLTKWLKRIDPLPTWEALVVVLRSRVVGEEKKAQELEKYCVGIPPIPTPAPDGRLVQGGIEIQVQGNTMVSPEETGSCIPEPTATSVGGQPLTNSSGSVMSSMDIQTEIHQSGPGSSESMECSQPTRTEQAQSGEHDHHIQAQHIPFVPSEVFPITPRSGISVKETRGLDVPLQNEPLGLTFATNEEEDESEPGMSRTELHDLQLQWMQTQEELAAMELERKQLHKDLELLREVNAKIMMEKEGESLQHQANTRELETALQKKIEENERLLQQVQGLQRIPRQMPGMNPDELYPMDKNPHGLCLIINNYRFHHATDPSKALSDRGGAEIDQYNLIQTFRYLRYKVEVHENLTSDQMTDCLMRMSQQDHSNYDSFVCCILCQHGSDSELVNINHLTDLMKLSVSLHNKPKLFFIQCCREMSEERVGEAEEAGFENDNPGGSSFRSTIPRDADFFLGYATPLGKAAYRSRKHGSWYISELCKVFVQYGYHSSLSTMMRRVNQGVSKAFTKDGYKQCTEFVDRLRREVHFFHFIQNRTKP